MVPSEKKKKAKRMSLLFYCTTGNVHWGGARKLSKSFKCRRSLSWNLTFFVPNVMKNVRGNYNSILRKVTFSMLNVLSGWLAYQLYGFCSLLHSCSKCDIIFRNFAYINFAVIEISSPYDVGGSLLYLVVCINIKLLLVCLPETFYFHLLICFVSCSSLVSSLVDRK